MGHWGRLNLILVAVQAQDMEGAAANVAHVLVHVAVMDVNDNEPVFLGQPFHALVSTVSPRGHVVTKVNIRAQAALSWGQTHVGHYFCSP